MDPEEYVELVLQCVESVPRGRVTTYGAIAEVAGEIAGGGGPRQVGSTPSSLPLRHVSQQVIIVSNIAHPKSTARRHRV